MQVSRSSEQNMKRFKKDRVSSQVSSGAVETEQKSTKRKRKGRAEDDIDELFDSALGNKKVRRALDHEDVDEPSKVPSEDIGDEGLRDVLGAIRRAPKEEEGRRKQRH
jgi:nucleolar protein 9